MERIFTPDDQLAFASLSGDYNPMHVDPIAARRFLFGRCVVHGIHALLWGIDRFIGQQALPPGALIRIKNLSVEFRNPILVNEPVELKIVSGNPGEARLEIAANGARQAEIKLRFENSSHGGESSRVERKLPEKGQCREKAIAGIASAAGRLPLCLEPSAALELFPNAARFMAPEQMAALLATTRLVGMETPGLHSLYLGLELADGAGGATEPELHYEVQGYDQRFSMLMTLGVKSPGFAGKLSVAFRPRPQNQLGVAELRRWVDGKEFAGQRALVIGGSRGLGELAVKQLVAGGAEVRFTYFKGSADAQRIIDEIAGAGGSASCFAYDVQKDGAKLADALGGWSPTLLCYFATPFISSTSPGRFSNERFQTFCDCYIDGFLNTFKAAGEGLASVFYPSSIAIEDPPPNMAEYAAAKSAAETMCRSLAKKHSGVVFHCPRLPRLPTDQTASLLEVEAADPQPIILEVLRRMCRGERPAATAPSASGAQAGEPAQEAGPAFAIAATFTAEPIESALEFWMSAGGRRGKVQFAQFNQIFQALLDPSGLLRQKNLANAVLVRLEDWVEGEKSTLSAAQWAQRLEPIIEEFLSALRGSSRAAPTLVVVTPPSAPLLADAAVAASLEKLTSKIIDSLKNAPGVYAFGPLAVAALYPVADYYDAGADAMGQIPYTERYFAALGTFLFRMSEAARRAPFKVIVLDCDNTLWSGVCGEGGVGAVQVGPGFRAMQEFMAQQTAAGKVLCLCSKNAESDVFDIFENHPDMLLKREHLVGWRINWSAKSGNLRELANELNLGLDSFIFLDDNPVECAEVRANCPEVLTLEAPADSRQWPDFLRHVWAFDQLSVTDQDRKRADSYRSNAQREAMREKSAGLEDFLARLGLQVDITTPAAGQMARFAQLTERTNQFNVSTRRRDEMQVAQLLKDSRYQCDVVEVKDRFGDYGLVGVVVTRADAGKLVVDTLLLSCRVLGRGVEHRMLAAIGQRARSLGLPAVEIPYVRTKKNQPVLDFLNAVAGDYRAPTADGFLYTVPAEFAAAVQASDYTFSAQAEGENAAPPVGQRGQGGQGVGVDYQHIVAELRDVDSILAAINAEARRTNQAQAPAEAKPGLEPKNERQRRLAQIWCNVLGLARVGIGDDYFKLGGTSVMAVRLVLEIEKVFGRQIPIATLLKAPTIEQLSNFLDDPADADDLAVVTLRAEGDQPPLFLLPGIGGHVIAYRQMPELLDTNRPVYGMEMRPEIAGNRVPRSMQQIASEFLERILKVEPNGPYFLAGWSFGGCLAFEVARQMRARGKEVAMVALLDTHGPGYPRVLPPAQRIANHFKHALRRSPAEQLNYFASGVRSIYELVKHRILMMWGVRKTNFHYELPLTQEMVKVCDDAWNAYRPVRWPGRLVLLRCTQHPDRIGISYDDPYNGWGELAAEMEVYPIDAAHLDLFKESAAIQTAAALSRGMRNASKLVGASI